ncbi:MAG: outer membrane beta-barrel protein [Flavobacteriaceae bacterium]|nr:outer membrane beta-barrel protein [Flavobacteriaceae bacterium]
MSASKRVFIVLTIFGFGSLLGFAQASYGLSAGTKLSPSKTLPKDISTEKLKQETLGYNVGAFFETGGVMFYVRPQLGYTWHKVEKEDLEFKESSLELPISFGYRFVPFASAYAGPTFHYTTGQSIESIKEIKLDDVKDNITYGLHLGARLHLGNFDLSLTYHRGLKSKEVELLGETAQKIGTLDTRPDYLILALAIKIGEQL